MAVQFHFVIRKTPKGATVTMQVRNGRFGGRDQIKRFRNGYASARISADRWVKERIAVIRECELVDGKPEAPVTIERIGFSENRPEKS